MINDQWQRFQCENKRAYNKAWRTPGCLALKLKVRPCETSEDGDEDFGLTEASKKGFHFPNRPSPSLSVPRPLVLLFFTVLRPRLTTLCADICHAGPVWETLMRLR